MPLTKKVGIVGVENQMGEFEKIYFNGDFSTERTQNYIFYVCAKG